MFSLSAKFEELGNFDWYTYEGRTKRTLHSNSTQTNLTNGDVFGIRLTRGGQRYYLIFPDKYHLNFIVEADEMDKILQRSSKTRKPKIQDAKADGRIRAPRVNQPESGMRRWDAPYFKAARSITGEAKEGIDFSNYQWRKLITGTLKLGKTLKIKHTVQRNDVFGVRFIKPATGGKYVDKMGRIFALSKEEYDQMLAQSEVLPKNRWPEGKLTKFDLEQIKQSDAEAIKNEAREKRRLLQEARRLEQERLAEEEAEKKRLRAEERLRKKREAEEAAKSLADRLATGKKEPVKPMTEEQLKDYLEQSQKKKENRVKNAGKLVKIEDDLDEDLDLTRADVYDRVDLGDEDVGSEAKDPLPLLDKVIADKRAETVKKVVDLKAPIDDEDEDEDEDDQDDVEYEEDTPKTSLKPKSEKPAVEETPAADPDDSDDGEIDQDALEAEMLPEAEVRENKYRAEEGHVVNFKSDSQDKRDFLILSIYPLPTNNSIMVYKVYDITNEPEAYHAVRIDTRQKRKFEDLVEFERKISDKDFASYEDLVEGYPRATEAIVS